MVPSIGTQSIVTGIEAIVRCRKADRTYGSVDDDLALPPVVIRFPVGIQVVGVLLFELLGLIVQALPWSAGKELCYAFSEQVKLKAAELKSSIAEGPNQSNF